MTTIPYSTTNVLNARCGQDAHIVGFMHKSNYRNNTNGALKVYEMWIIPLQWNSNNYGDANLQNDLFTRHGLSLDTDGTWSNDLASILYDEPINSAKFCVLKKRSFTLAPRLATGLLDNGGNLRNFKMNNIWIKVGRKYTYGTSTDSGEVADTSIQPPVFYISWTNGILEAPGTAPETNAVTRELHVVTYFRDGESGA